MQTFLESKLPFKQLSLIADADRRARDPVYGAHRWWARRPPGVIRGLLLAAALPSDIDESEFWRLFRSTGHALEGQRVHDLFIGGGTTVVEAEISEPRQRDTDICLFDPPYFDYIAYSELSEFYRAWLNQIRLGGKPLLPDKKAPTRSYARTLARCLKSALRRLKYARPLAFTFHSADPAAWEAIGSALDRAQLLITAMWPVRNDAHMGHHAKEANCEWDLVKRSRKKRKSGERQTTLSLVIQTYLRRMRICGIEGRGLSRSFRKSRRGTGWRILRRRASTLEDFTPWKRRSPYRSR